MDLIGLSIHYKSVLGVFWSRPCTKFLRVVSVVVVVSIHVVLCCTVVVYTTDVLIYYTYSIHSPTVNVRWNILNKTT
jgi:hypothetical protein